MLLGTWFHPDGYWIIQSPLIFSTFSHVAAVRAGPDVSRPEDELRHFGGSRLGQPPVRPLPLVRLEQAALESFSKPDSDTPVVERHQGKAFFIRREV